MYQYGDWKTIYNEQITTLKESGLLDAANFMFIGVNGNQDIQYNYSNTHKIVRNDSSPTTGEYHTLKALYDYCSLQENACVLFLHTKGVTWSVPENFNNLVPTYKGVYTSKNIYENATLWRKYLEYFSVKKWRNCVELLNEYDCVGTEWDNTSNIGGIHYDVANYAGTVWWANSEYIRKLDINFITNNLIIGRYANELWISTKKPKYYNFYYSAQNLYLYPILEQEYKNICE